MIANIRRDRVVGQALRASLYVRKHNAAHPDRPECARPNCNFYPDSYQLAVERQRIADARAERQHREAIQSKRPVQTGKGVNHQRIDIVVQFR